MAHSNIPYALVSEKICKFITYSEHRINSCYQANLLKPIFSILLCCCVCVVAGAKFFASSLFLPADVHLIDCFSPKAFSMIPHSSQECTNLPLGTPAATAFQVAAHEIAFRASFKALCLLAFCIDPFAKFTGAICLTIFPCVLGQNSTGIMAHLLLLLSHQITHHCHHIGVGSERIFVQISLLCYSCSLIQCVPYIRAV